MSLRKLLIELEREKDLYEYTQEELMEILEDNGIALEDRQLDYYIGSGGYGDVYKVKGKNKVIKFTTNVDEFEKIEHIMQAEKNHKPEHVVKYYFNKKFTDSLSFSVMEYLEKTPINFGAGVKRSLKLMEKSVYEVLDEGGSGANDIMLLKIRDFLTHMSKNRATTDKIINDLKKAFKSIVQKYSIQDVDIILKWIWNVISIIRKDDLIGMIHEIDLHHEYFKDLIQGIKELKEMDVWHGDTHKNNILKVPNKQKYKLIDPI